MAEIGVKGRAMSGVGRVMTGGGGRVGAWGMVGREARARSGGMGLDDNEAGGAGRGAAGWDRTGHGRTRRTGQDTAERGFAGQGVERWEARAGQDVAVHAAGGAGRETRQDGTARDKQWNPAPTGCA